MPGTMWGKEWFGQKVYKEYMGIQGIHTHTIRQAHRQKEGWACTCGVVQTEAGEGWGTMAQ